MSIEYRDGIAGKVCTNSACREWKPLKEFHPRRLRGVPAGDGYKAQCKACLNADRRRKRTAHPEKYREAARAYVEANRKRVSAAKRAHRQAHPERYAASLKVYRETHREEINTRARERRAARIEHYRAIGRASRARHREERNAASRAYFKTHHNKARAAFNRRRVRKYQAEGSHTEAEWEALKAQHNYTCLCCGKCEPEIELQRDHIIPLTKGGSDYITNIQPLCRSCNSSKSDKFIDYRTKGLCN